MLNTCNAPLSRRRPTSGDGGPVLCQTTTGRENLENAVTLVIQFSGPHVEKREGGKFKREKHSESVDLRQQTLGERCSLQITTIYPVLVVYIGSSSTKLHNIVAHFMIKAKGL